MDFCRENGKPVALSTAIWALLEQTLRDNGAAWVLDRRI